MFALFASLFDDHAIIFQCWAPLTPLNPSKKFVSLIYSRHASCDIVMNDTGFA